MTARCRHQAVAVASLFGLALILLAFAGRADAAPKLGFVKVAEAEQPTSMASPPGYPQLMFVTEREGKIRILRRGKMLKKPLLDLSSRIDPLRIERGLLGLAFPPEFRKTGVFYVNYTARNGDSLLEEYGTRPGQPTVLRNHRRLVMRILRVNDNGNHNGGHLAFHGKLLYISVGDGFDPGDLPDSAQNLESRRGKILRINPRQTSRTGIPRFRIPAGNPFVGQPGLDEVFAYGLRNPHSFDFFKGADGRQMIAISDVGQGRYEELNVLPLDEARGANFGWNDYEGFEPYNCGELYCPNGSDPTATTGLTWPQLVYTHEDGCAIIGGPVIEDPALTTVKGRVIYGDFCGNRIRTAAPRNPTILDDKPAGFYLPPGKDRHSALNGFGVDGFKRIYAFSHFGGIYRIVQR